MKLLSWQVPCAWWLRQGRYSYRGDIILRPDMSLAYIRSLLITDPIIIIATIIMGSFSLLASIFDSEGKLQHTISRVWSRMLLAVSGVKMEIEGLEKID